MDEIYIAYQRGDFDISVVIGVGTDMDKAERLIKKKAAEFNYKLRELPDKKFCKITSQITSQDTMGIDYDYWIEKEKLNTLFF
jgi:hypothetical protein